MNISLIKNIKEIWHENYVVPLYQRNFAWSSEEIGELIQDIYDHYAKCSVESDEGGLYYLGTLVLMHRYDDKYEVIDGQQRLTALQLLSKYLNVLKSSRITYDSRPQVEKFFENLFKSESLMQFGNDIALDNNKTVRLEEAIGIIENYQIRIDDDDNKITLNTMSDNDRTSFANHILNRVVLVCTELPEDTDVASYFEIMNNRGEQLQAHEVIKALLMRDLNDYNRKIFGLIWDGCSQMNIPIQQALSDLRRNGWFGVDYDTLNLDLEISDSITNTDLRNPKSIKEILDRHSYSANNVKKDDGDENNNYISILDFPNFLMLVFRLYEDTTLGCSAVPLNADKMEFSAPDFVTDAMDFIKFMLKVRTIFDRYIIKIQEVSGDNTSNDDNEIKWCLKRPHKYSYKDRDRLRFNDTFSPKADSNEDDNEHHKGEQKKIVMQQSMLQVTFRSRKYKEWVYQLLKYLIKEYDNSSSLNFKPQYISTFLDKWILRYYNDLRDNYSSNKNELFSDGTNTPHFLLNFIDYLYWLAYKKSKLPQYNYSCTFTDFSFRNYNSVEHHYPQNPVSLPAIKNVDSIGNLCLISRHKNSSLSNRIPLEKAQIKDELQPKRKIMYYITNNENWDEKKIYNHFKDVENLLNDAEILME